MTNEKCLEVLLFYEEHLQKRNTKLYSSLDIEHLRSMFPKMRSFIEEGRRDKFFRWLGFMQGVLWAYHEFSLEDLCDHNRSDRGKL